MVNFYSEKNSSHGKSSVCSKCMKNSPDFTKLTCGHIICRACFNNNQGDIIKCASCSEETSKRTYSTATAFPNDNETLQIKHQPYPEADRLRKDQISPGERKMHYLTSRHQREIVRLVPHLTNRLTTECADRAFSMDIVTASANTITTTTIDSGSNPMQEVYDMINVLAGGIQAFNDDTQRLSTESIRIQTAVDSVSQELTSLKLSVQEQSSRFDEINSNQKFLSQDVAPLKQKMDDLQNVSYDGTLIWKITSFREKMMDAQSERQTSIYSPPFFSSPTGYKMRARLYPNGDGNARRTHMSLFFVLMRGSYDAILKFPFSYKVTFCLYDQTPQQRHIVDSFRPDIKSNSFQRPRSEMNIASGIPKFVPLTTIHRPDSPYIQKDAMFIKIMVNFDDIPTTILPFALTLDPGLPMHVQQVMITEEIERRSKSETGIS